MTVEELLTKKHIDFKVSGQDFVIKCLNPEHDDSNPSMRIDKVLGIFNCLSCGFKGNIFYYFGEKVDKLDTSREKLRRKLSSIRAQSVGLKIPVDSEALSSDYRVSLATLNKFGAFRTSNQDLQGRIVFPIKDLKGKIVAFVGRSEDRYEKVKYKVYPPKRQLPLFPLGDVSPEQGRVILVEGLFDLLNLYDNGYRNVLCTFGTQNKQIEKFKLLQILGVTGVDLMFDPDKPGQEASLELKDDLEELGLHVRNIKLRTGDPGDLTPNHAANLRRKLYE
jgi:DNA primase